MLNIFIGYLVYMLKRKIIVKYVLLKLFQVVQMHENLRTEHCINGIKVILLLMAIALTLSYIHNEIVIAADTLDSLAE